ncbi:MAG: Rieske 2Fe-2S domain-containing protein [Gammaproteobacteria bacterium]
MSDQHRGARPCAVRRALVAGTAFALVAPPWWRARAADLPPERQPPQVGDQLAWPSWEATDRLLAADDLVAGAEPLLVYPRDAASGVARERSRLNQLLVCRLPADALDDTTRALAAGDVVAYSAICTHTACGITGWDGARQHFVCPCHQSEFAAGRAGSRVTGPAPRALPALPIAQDGDHFVIRGDFTSAVGASS